MCFSSTSQSWGLRRVVPLKSPLKSILMKACRFVNNQEVFQALGYFGVLDEAELSALSEDSEQPLASPTALVSMYSSQHRSQYVVEDV